MGNNLKKALYQKEYLHDQKIYEKTFNIVRYLGNAKRTTLGQHCTFTKMTKINANQNTPEYIKCFMCVE